MIKFENTEVVGWEHAIRGMRNPMNSWEKSDSGYCMDTLPCHSCKINRNNCKKCMEDHAFIIGENDVNLMNRLRNAGTDHRKFMRMITAYVDITAPLYWWKEFDTYKVGTVANSCSTMHKISDKEFTLEDFSCEHMDEVTLDTLNYVITQLEYDRLQYLKAKDKKFWWQMIQLLPSSYNQKRTVMMNYEVLANIYKSRRNHRLDEWSELMESTCNVKDDARECKNPKEWLLCEDCSVGKGFCDWIKTLPYYELITGEFETKKANDNTSVLTPNEYQKQAARTMDKTLTPNGQLEEGLMGLNGEAGECLEILKKHLFQNQTLNKEHLAEELGDVAWYLAESAYAIDYDLEMILKMNLRKLEERYPDIDKAKKNEEEN